MIKAKKSMCQGLYSKIRQDLRRIGRRILFLFFMFIFQVQFIICGKNCHYFFFSEDLSIIYYILLYTCVIYFISYVYPVHYDRSNDFKNQHISKNVYVFMNDRSKKKNSGSVVFGI